MLAAWLKRRRQYRDVIVAEAAALIEREGGAGYYTARAVQRAARGQGDREAAKLWGRVALLVAKQTGLVPGHSKIGRPESEW